jgi:outer membrane lipoprotein-sorting protein
MRTSVQFSLAAVLLALAPAARAGEPTALEIVRKYDQIMGPENFEAVSLMTAHRDDDSERTYKMKYLKSGKEKFRLWFQEPAAVRGQELLRQGENSWLYMPQLKRSVRLANRDSFQGGDFNNADVLRVNYEADYTPALAADTEGVADSHLLELRAKTKDAAYDRVKLWVRKADILPIKAEYYSESGKMLRAAEFSDVKEFGNGLKRPARIVMKNMLATKRYSVMTLDTMNTKVAPSSSRFVLDDLGR